MIPTLRIPLLVFGALSLLACGSQQGIGQPGPSGGPTLPGGSGSGSPFPTPGAGLPGPEAGLPAPPVGGSGPSMPGMGKPGQGDGEDLEDVFEKSLGDFDGEMERERAAMERAGQGSSRSAQQREGADADTVGDSQMKTGGASGGVASIPGASESDSETSASRQPPNQQESGEQAGEGQSDVEYEGKGGKVESSKRDGANVAKIPNDIPTDTAGDDQVARQIREAAMAEEDPLIREALWEEYRKHTGIKQ